MVRSFLALLALAVLTAIGCGPDADGDGDLTVEFPHTVTLGAEQALIARTGEVIDHADFISGDLVTFTNQTIMISAGCPDNLTDCQPLHICKKTGHTVPATIDEFSAVCSNIPSEEEDPENIPNAESQTGFTVRLNTEEGCARVWIKEVTGAGASAKVTLVYSLFNLPE